MKKTGRRCSTLTVIILAMAFMLGGCIANLAPIPGDVSDGEISDIVTYVADPVVVIPVPSCPLTAAFTWTQGKAKGEIVRFDGSISRNCNGTIVWGKWDFDDGTAIIKGPWVRFIDGERFSVNREVSHRFWQLSSSTNDRNYTVTLTVRDDEGNTNSASRTIVIR